MFTVQILALGTSILAAFTFLLAKVASFALAADPAVLPADLTDLGAMGKLILDAVQNKNYGLLASLVVLLAVAALRKWTPETSKLGAWLKSKLGGMVTSLALSLGGAFATAFMAGASFSLELCLKALTVALTASGGWAIYKNFREALDEGKAQTAGVEASENKAKVEETLNK